MIRLLKKFLQRPVLFVCLGAGLTTVLFIPLIWLTLQAYISFNRILGEDFKLRQLSDQITYLDEVLTMSALMNAATGDRTWENRYRSFEPVLDAAIQESITLASKAYNYNNKGTQATDIANQKLIELESQSFDLVQQGRAEAAFSLLSGLEYKTLKQQYKQGVDQRNQAIQIQLDRQVQRYRRQLVFSTFLSGLSLIFFNSCLVGGSENPKNSPSEPQADPSSLNQY
ncbi:MAG: hypothetical protein HC920_19785 [Oscillatoriales cyanobacterium SM2_3_0]|nr:hypothetical protein [Oscillatoriales cyanobacterium SM2_3_0]